ncbi:MAG: polysaccharide deacetylase family protein [Sphingobacteriales bacterium]|nr:polysaccharide deacetylase family protein [Sphingobacteriales bacterium]
MFYFTKAPWFLKIIYMNCIWQMQGNKKALYLSFDDGPHPLITPFVLDELKKYGAKATFFCIGKNVLEHNTIYSRIIAEGHKVGNHTQNHLNGWKTEDEIYLNDIAEAKKCIDSELFRPPYGKITKFQLKQLATPRFQLKSVMWSVLSGDFDIKLSPEKCLRNVLKNTTSGSIIVFHDSEKAFERLEYVLPKVLDHFSAKGYSFDTIEKI